MESKAAPAGQEDALCSRSPDFESELRARVTQAGAQALLAGNISLIGLDTIKARLGARWAAVSERAHRITCNTIARHLGPGDIFTAWQETNYVIVFGNVPRQQAQIKCRLIALEIGKALLGEEGAEHLEVKTGIATLDGGLALGGMPALAELLQTAAAATDGANAEAGQAVPGARSEIPPSEPQFLFSPMWDCALSALSTYRCAMTHPSAAQGDASPLGSDETSAGDFLLLKRVLEELERITSCGRRLLLFLPVHFETLAAGVTRRRFFDNLGAGVRAGAPTLLVFEIVGMPSGIPHSRLLDLVAPLRRHCRSVVAHVPLEVDDLSVIKGTGINAVGCDVAARTASDLVLMQLIGRFQRIAERAGLSTYIRGLRSRSLAAGALGAGFRYLEGEAVSKAVATPQALRQFGLLDIYRSLVVPSEPGI